MIKKILYIRSGPYKVDPNSYNLQELGLAQAFAMCGVQCDVVYYHDKKNSDEIIKKGEYDINVFWRRGIKLLRSGIYPQLLKRDFLSVYDAVIVSEYSQIMSVLICKLHSNVYINNGPYYNLFKLPFLESIYDNLFVKTINKNVRTIFCKTKMSKEYLEKKGFRNCIVAGVGLDTDKFDKDNEIEDSTQDLLDRMNGKNNIVYVGSISRRKNIEVITKAFDIIVKRNSINSQLIIIGKDENGYWNECEKYLSEEAKKYVLNVSYIKNSQLQYIYKAADVFVLPSIHEIFGMVLLEAMYFGVPSIASGSAGAKTLIENNISGYVIENFDEQDWANKIEEILSDETLKRKMGLEASNRIRNKFTWINIAEIMLKRMKNDE